MSESQFAELASSVDAEAHIARLRRQLDPQSHPGLASLMTSAIDLFVSLIVIFYVLEADTVLELESSVSCMTGQRISFLSSCRTSMILHTKTR